MSKKINLKDNIKSAGIWTSTTNAGVGAGWIGGQTNDWRLASLYVNNAVVHACISMVASSVASINFNLFDFPIAKNKPVEPIQIDNHP
jgi:phage portal protein BeeE